MSDAVMADAPPVDAAPVAPPEDAVDASAQSEGVDGGSAVTAPSSPKLTAASAEALLARVAEVQAKLLEGRFEARTRAAVTEMCTALAASAPAIRSGAAAAGVFALLTSALQVAECAVPACEAVAALASDASTARALRAAGVLPPLVALLSPVTNPAALAAASALRAMASECEVARDAARQAGAIPPLVLLLHSGPRSPLSLASASALRNLARNNEANRDALRESGGIAPLVALLDAGETEEARSRARLSLARARLAPLGLAARRVRQPAWLLRANARLRGSAQLRKSSLPSNGGCAAPDALSPSAPAQVTAHACAAITNMAFRNAYNAEFIRKANGTGGVPPLVRLLSAGPGRDVTKYAAGAIANLTFDSDENCAAVLAANGVAPLAALLRYACEPGGAGATDATSFAIDALRNLSRCNDAARDAAREAGALPLLVALLGPPGAAPTPLTRAAAGALRNLAANNDINRAAIRAAGECPVFAIAARQRVLTRVRYPFCPSQEASSRWWLY
jgi:hypothetical protein